MTDQVLDASFGKLPSAYARLVELDALLWDGRIDVSLLELCRIRIAKMHDCASELALVRVTVDPEKRAALSRWPTSPLFDGRERAMLAFAEQYVIDAHGVTNDDAARVTAVLSGSEVAAFTTAIAVFDATCRFKLALNP